MRQTESGQIIGINRRCYPSEDTGYGAKVIVVLVTGAIGDYAAYAGQGSPQWVAQYGNKLSFSEACIHFPGQLSKTRYRR